MSSVSELYFSNHTKRPSSEEMENSTSPYLTATYHLPILWLALYEASNEKVATEGTDKDWHYYCQSTKESVALLNSRKELILSLFPNLKKDWFNQFYEFIINSDFEYVHLETQQVGSVAHEEADGWNDEFLRMLKMFDDPNILNEPNIFDNPKLFMRQEKPQPKKHSIFTWLFSKPISEKQIPETGWAIYQKRFGTLLTGEEKNNSWLFCGASGTDEILPWE